MKRTTESRNRREGRYAGQRARSTIELNRYNWIRVPGARHFREGRDRAPALRPWPETRYAAAGCGEQGYSGMAGYPDLMCTDGYMSDMDADGDDPSVARQPCPKCRPGDYTAWFNEQQECDE